MIESTCSAAHQPYSRQGMWLAHYDFQLVAHKLCGAVDLIRTAGHEQVAAAEITGRFLEIFGCLSAALTSSLQLAMTSGRIVIAAYVDGDSGRGGSSRDTRPKHGKGDDPAGTGMCMIV